MPNVVREHWSGHVGFLLSALGSSFGLGKFWRFPGLAYTHGGGAFILPYLVALLTAGIPLLFLELALGNRFVGSSPTTFRHLGKRYEALGWFQVALCFVVMTYYTVLIGWSVRYVYFSATLAWGSDPKTFFLQGFLQATPPGATSTVDVSLLWPVVAVWAAVTVVVALGIQRGVEVASRVFLPVLLVTFLILVIRSLFLPGAVQGIDALFAPQWSALADPQVWVAAFSHLFFSLSIAFGIWVTYASYLKPRSNLVVTGYVTAFANSALEILSGIGVFAALGFMAFREGTTVAGIEGITGVSLSFIAFPNVISAMPGGALFGVFFFGCMVLAGFNALTSLVQVVSAALQEKFGLTRGLATMLLNVTAAIPSVLLFATTNGVNALDVVDKWTSEIGTVLSAVAMCVLVAFVAKKLPELQQHLNQMSTATVGRWWILIVTWVTPGMLTYMLIATLISLITKGYGTYPASFVTEYGWGTLVALGLLTIMFTFARWRTPVDRFTAVPLDNLQPTSAGEGT